MAESILDRQVPDWQSSSLLDRRVPAWSGLTPRQKLLRGLHPEAAPQLRERIVWVRQSAPNARVTSTYRPGAKVRGTGKPSYHGVRLAADFAFPGWKNTQIVAFARRFDKENPGWEAIVEPPGSRYAGRGNRRTIMHIEPKPGRLASAGRLIAGGAVRATAKGVAGAAEALKSTFRLPPTLGGTVQEAERGAEVLGERVIGPRARTAFRPGVSATLETAGEALPFVVPILAEKGAQAVRGVRAARAATRAEEAAAAARAAEEAAAARVASEEAAARAARYERAAAISRKRKPGDRFYPPTEPPKIPRRVSLPPEEEPLSGPERAAAIWRKRGSAVRIPPPEEPVIGPRRPGGRIPEKPERPPVKRVSLPTEVEEITGYERAAQIWRKRRQEERLSSAAEPQPLPRRIALGQAGEPVLRPQSAEGLAPEVAAPAAEGAVPVSAPSAPEAVISPLAAEFAGERGAILNPAVAAVELARTPARAYRAAEAVTRQPQFPLPLRSERSVLEGLGEPGTHISRGLRAIENSRALAGPDVVASENAMQAMRVGAADDLAYQRRVLEGVAGLENPAVANELTGKLAPIRDKWGKLAERAGVEVRRRGRITKDAETNLLSVEGGKRYRFQRRPNYLSHGFRDPAQLDYLESKAGGERAARYLVATRQAATEEEALGMLSRQVRGWRARKFGPAQIAREADVPGYWGDLRRVRFPDDAPEVIARKEALAQAFGYGLVTPEQAVNEVRAAWQGYLEGMARTIERVTQFGNNDSKLLESLGRIRKEVGRDAATDAARTAELDLGQTEIGPKLRFAQKIIGAFTRFVKLPTVAIANAPQGAANSAFRFGTENALQGVAKALRKQGWQEAAEAGVLSEPMQREVLARLTGMGRGPLDRISGSYFLHTEEAGWVVGYHSTRAFIERNLAIALQSTGRRQANAIARLQELLPGYEDMLATAIREGRPLTETVKRVMGFEGAKQVMFLYTAQEMPRFFASPTGRFFAMFKQYPAAQASMVSRHIGRELAMGNPRPLLEAALVFAGVGEAIGISRAALRALIRRDPTELQQKFRVPSDKTDLALRVVDDYINLGLMGWQGDLAQRYFQEDNPWDRARVLGEAAGGPVGDVVEAMVEVPAASLMALFTAPRRKTETPHQARVRHAAEAGRAAFKQAPLGYLAQPALAPTEGQRRAMAEKRAEEMLRAGDTTAAAKALQAGGYKEVKEKLRRMYIEMTAP